MSIKSTISLNRNEALELIAASISCLPNEQLAAILDLIADGDQSPYVDYFNNFLVFD